MQYRQRDDDRQYITYFEAERRDKVGRARQRALMREQSNAEADQQSWASVLGCTKTPSQHHLSDGSIVVRRRTLESNG
jgi:hypothetical protein